MRLVSRSLSAVARASLRVSSPSRLTCKPCVSSKLFSSEKAAQQSNSNAEVFKKATVSVHDEFLRLNVGNDTHDYHWFFLYHNCSSWLHPTTRERQVDVPDVPLDIRPRKVDIHAGTLYITWPALRQSEFSVEWLVKHSYAINRQLPKPPASNVSLIEVNYKELQKTSSNLKKDYSRLVADRIDKYGAALVRGRGIDTEDIIRDFSPSGEVWESHFGRIEDLRTDNTTNKNTDQLGYTNAGVAPHTDMPFMQHPPSMQMLQGMRAADLGGESYLVDARAAALYLKAINPVAFDLLRTRTVEFHRKQKNFTAVTHFPLIETYGDYVHQIRYSYFTLAPFRLPYEWMKEWYEAYKAFAEILVNEKFQFRFLLQEGDFIIYSNRTMVHARESFHGPRWVRGIYLDQDSVLAHLRKE